MPRTCNDKALLSAKARTPRCRSTSHWRRNPGKVPLEIIEVQSGNYLGEDDIVRYDEEYGRA